jgi:sec-independent protein translocase protein TatA
MLANLSGWHALIILGIVVLIFGAGKLPALARSVGQSMKIFQSEIKTAKTVETPEAETPVEEPTLSAVPIHNARQ